MADDASGLGGFLPGMLGDLMKLLRSDAVVQWELAFQLASSIAAEGDPDPNPDPVERIRLEELLAIADLHVGDVSGMTTAPNGTPVGIVVLGRAEWARRNLEGWKPVLETIAASLAAPGTAPIGGAIAESADERDGAELAAFLTQWTSVLAPAMIAMQIGSVVGHLATRALGQYELPLVRSGAVELLVVPANTAAFAEDWSLPRRDVELYLLVRDVATHAVLGRPHVRARLERLLGAHATNFRPNPEALTERLTSLGGGAMPDVNELTAMLGDPSAFATLDESEDARRTASELTALVSTITGYVEWVTEAVAGRSIGAHQAIREALRRRRVERGEEERVTDALFGLHLEQDVVDRGEAFVRGVVGRGGDAQLARLWTDETNLPTPAELDAPGLWLARLELPELNPPA